MRYEKLFEKGKYSLILRKLNLDEYAVVYGLNEESGEWQHTVDYWNFGKYSCLDKVEALQAAIECFRMKTENNYISRYRLEELATKFKDGLIEYDELYASSYFDEECEMEEHEKKFFEVETESEEE